MIKTFLTIKFLQLLIIQLTPSKFDTSSLIIYQTYEHHNLLNKHLINFLQKLVVWDNVYFFNLFINEAKYENEYVFSPGWVSFIRYIMSFIYNGSDYYLNILVAVTISNFLQLITSFILYYFSLKIFDSLPFFKNFKRLSYLTSVYYLLSSGGVFLTAGYSENLASFLCITSLYLRELSLNYDLNSYRVKNVFFYLLSGILIGFSFQVRANCLLLGVIYLWDLYNFTIFKNPKELNFLKHFKISIDMILSIFGGLPLFFNLLYSNYIAYKKFCPGVEWCNYTIPSLFSYCQSKYWHNGFLSYWTPNNIPNFIIALPMIILNISSMFKFLITYPNRKMIPYIILNGLTILGGVFFWNVQILNRILNFNPIFYWYLSIQNDKWVARILITWILFQAGLFSGFLPPA